MEHNFCDSKFKITTMKSMGYEQGVASGVKGSDNSNIPGFCGAPGQWGPHKIQEFYYIGPCSVNNSNILLVV